MLNSKFFVDKMGSQIVEKFPDPVQLNALFEIAQKMIDEGKEKKEIKKILKDLYGASKEELARMEEKLFKNKVNAEIHPDAILTELKAIEDLLEEQELYEHFEQGVELNVSEPIHRIKKLIKELEGGKGTRQEGSTEVLANDALEGNFEYAVGQLSHAMYELLESGKLNDDQFNEFDEKLAKLAEEFTHTVNDNISEGHGA
jgi:hypothetical protein